MAEEVANKPVAVMAAEEPALASGPPPPPKDVVEEKALVPAAPVMEKASEQKATKGSLDRDIALARVETEKRLSFIKAWEETEKSKAENKAEKKLAEVTAWENSKKAAIEAQLKKIEEQLEKKKADYAETQKNKIAAVHKQAEEKRAMVDARRREEILKAEEMSAKYRATNQTPKNATVVSQTAYDYFSRRANRVIWARTVWDSFIPPKYSFTLWLAIRGRLLTRDRLDYLHIDQTCGLCGGGTETVDHLYFACPLSKALWMEMRRWCGLRRGMSTLKAALKWLKIESRGKTWTSRWKRPTFVCTVYYIWLSRNRLYFQNLSPNLLDITHRIKTHVYRVGYALYPNVLILC